MKPADPFASMAAALTGSPGPADAVRDGANRIPDVIAVLQASDKPAAHEWAAALADYYENGGDLAALLGIKCRRGGAYDRPGRQKRQQRRDASIAQLAASLPGAPTAKAEALSARLRTGHPSTAVFRDEFPDAPTSKGHLTRILKRVIRPVDAGNN